jgi:hypothetical protein
VSKTECVHEVAVNRALDSDDWPAELLQHVAECAVCSDLMVVAKFLQRQAELTAPEAPLPDPSLIWLRAQLKARAAASDRATLVIGVVHRVALACGALLAMLGIVRLWPQWKSWLMTLLPNSIPNPLPSNMAQPGLVVIATVAVLVFWVLFDLHEPHIGR